MPSEFYTQQRVLGEVGGSIAEDAAPGLRGRSVNRRILVTIHTIYSMSYTNHSYAAWNNMHTIHSLSSLLSTNHSYIYLHGMV